MPFSHPDVREAAIKLITSKWRNEEVLDVGVGDGFYGETLHQNLNAIVYGIEVWPKYIVNQLLYYRTIFLCDARKFEYNLLSKKIGLVILGDVVEHFERSEAVTLVRRLQELFPWIVLTIPIIDVPQGAYMGNVYETHLYQWKIPEIERDLGFRLIKNCGMCGLFEYAGVRTRQIVMENPILVPRTR